MNSDRKQSGASLQTVARFYELQLEEARVQRAVADKETARQRRFAEQIQQRIDEAQGLARERMQSEHGVSADALRQAGAYEKWESRSLAEQQERVNEAEAASGKARAEVTRRYQALSAIEQLQERRARDAAMEAARAEQKTLDEHALLRTAPVRR
jgi:flagellar biosynthesis chaperone FliJ